MKRILAASLGTILLIAGCTGNPLFEDDGIVDRNTIRGKVVLSDGASPFGAYVWLEFLSLGTRVDSSGNFELNLSAASGPASKAEGPYHLYFFVANYNLDSAVVVFRDGKLLPGKGDVAEDGSLRHTITLRKFLDIEVRVAPPTIPTNYKDSLFVAVVLQPHTGQDSITVELPGLLPEGVAQVLFVHLRDDSVEVMATDRYAITGSSNYHLVQYHPLTLTLLLPWPTDRYAPGGYRFLPHVRIHHQPLPKGMLKSLSVKHTIMDMLRIPYKVSGGRLQVTPAT